MSRSVVAALGVSIAVLCLWLSTGRAGAPTPPPGFTPDPNPSASRELKAPRPLSPGQAVAGSLLFIYQHGAGPTKGQRCPMAPSCSEYARLSVESRGLIMGTVLASDRLHRCGHDLRFYKTIVIDGREFSYDPPRVGE